MKKPNIIIPFQLNAKAFRENLENFARIDSISSIEGIEHGAPLIIKRHPCGDYTCGTYEGRRGLRILVRSFSAFTGQETIIDQLEELPRGFVSRHLEFDRRPDEYVRLRAALEGRNPSKIAIDCQSYQNLQAQ